MTRSDLLERLASPRQWLRHLRRVDVWYPNLYVLCIVALSIQIMLGADSSRDHRRVLMGVIEIFAALGMLIPIARTASLELLLAVFLLATILTVHFGRLPTSLIIYAASAIVARHMRSTSSNRKSAT